MRNSIVFNVVALCFAFCYIANVYALSDQPFARHSIPSWKADRNARAQRLIDPDVSFVEEEVKFEHKFEERKIGDNFPITITKNVLPFYRLSFVSDTVSFGLDTSHNVWISQDSFIHWNKTIIDPRDQVSGIYPSPVDNRTVFFLGGFARSGLSNNASYVTTDLGATYQRIPTNLVMDAILFHPSQKTWALGVKKRILYVTQNFGATWEIIRDKITFATWCHAGQDGIPAQRICMITDVVPEELGLPLDTTSGLVGKSRFVRTDDLGSSIEVMLPLESSYLIVHEIFFFVIATDTTGKPDLFVSKDHGQTFHQAKLPSGLNVPYLYPDQFLDDTTGAIWIGVNHEQIQYNNVFAGNLYVSDTDGFRFSETLTRVVTLSNWWDFDIVRSLEGTYLANEIAPSESDASPDVDVELMIRTMITFDNGRRWHRLAAPDFDCNGVPINCSGCSLNLFGRTTWIGIGGGGNYGDFYSAPDAVGLILATGNVGPYLSFEADTVSTWMSRDGGLSWIELMKGSTVYEYGDHGGILVLVNNQVPTTSLYYSLDEGETWTTLSFTTEPVVVTSIFTTATTGEKFVIFGRANNQPVYYGIDMSQLTEVTCSPNDYETWSPQDGRRANDSCVLGHHTVYQRRIRSKKCFSPDDISPVVSVTACNCTTEDYECDYGYEKTFYSQTCALVEDMVDEEADIKEQCANPANNGMYLLSQGYRLIPGDTCENHLPKYGPIIKDCPDFGTSGSSSSTTSTTNNEPANSQVQINAGLVALFSILSIFVIAGAIAVGIVIGAKSERVRNCVHRKSGYKYANVTEQDDDDDRTVGIRREDDY